ncbi:MAG TPA: pyrroloquinoline quinone precursor peptide PqqA [Rhodanobacter sp.]
MDCRFGFEITMYIARR